MARQNDSVGKPFQYPELVARIGAVLERARGRRKQGTMQIGGLRIDPSSSSSKYRKLTSASIKRTPVSTTELEELLDLAHSGLAKDELEEDARAAHDDREHHNGKVLE